MAHARPPMDGIHDTRDTPERLAEGVHLLPLFGNSTCIDTGDGLVLVDTSVRGRGPRLLEMVRALSDAPIRYVIYTHGHLDHAFGVWALLEEAARRGRPRPVIVGHEAVAARFDRYLEMARYTEHINRIQFRVPPEQRIIARERFHYPDLTYRDRLDLTLGEVRLELRHAKGETDDATWVWIPERRVACAGDLFLWSCPNIGNPFKVQRYEVEWAEALEAIAARAPVALAPGHGPGLRGEAAVREACLDTARALRWLHDEVVRRLNAGMWPDAILREVTALPPDLAARPYLAPTYGCPTFIVHGILRRYHGWFDGNASHLFPASAGEIAADVVSLAGERALLARARERAGAGEPQRALHLVDFVLDGGGAAFAAEAQALKAELLAARAAAEPSYIARSILENGAAGARAAAAR
ncbi:MAG TPA: alkyl sulfatase dimerization domain-containing protein [Methylomirabilota bacterium]|nr:alkyl sulfatase dimerization domain-containing protein [Methylomirabilota bacterium]